MTFIKQIVGIFFLVFINFNVAGQLVWSTPIISSDNGTVVGVDVLVSGYQNLISAQGTIAFDHTILEYSHVSDFALSSISGNSFGTNDVDSGKLSFSWYEPDLIGKAINDNDAAFTIYFNVVGSSGDVSFVDLVDQPVIAEFIDASFNSVTYSFIPGNVTVNDALNISEETTQIEYNVFPNPAIDWVSIESKISLYDFSVFLYKMDGSLVKEVFCKDSDKVKFDTSDLNAGTYLLRIGTKNMGFNNQLIRLL